MRLSHLSNPRFDSSKANVLKSFSLLLKRKASFIAVRISFRSSGFYLRQTRLFIEETLIIFIGKRIFTNFIIVSTVFLCSHLGLHLTILHSIPIAPLLLGNLSVSVSVDFSHQSIKLSVVIETAEGSSNVLDLISLKATTSILVTQLEDLHCFVVWILLLPIGVLLVLLLRIHLVITTS